MTNLQGSVFTGRRPFSGTATLRLGPRELTCIINLFVLSIVTDSIVAFHWVRSTTPLLGPGLSVSCQLLFTRQHFSCAFATLTLIYSSLAIACFLLSLQLASKAITVCSGIASYLLHLIGGTEGSYDNRKFYVTR